MFRVFEKRQINQEEMVELLQDIKEALENTQRYLLDGNQLLFEPEFLFFIRRHGNGICAIFRRMMEI